MNRSAAALVGLCCSVLILAPGCSSGEEDAAVSAEQVAAIMDELRAKGPVEAELRRLDPIVEEMADAVVTVVPGLSWRRNREEMRLGCEAVPGDPGSASSWTLRNVVFDGPIPDALWPEALNRVRQIADREGASELIVRVDKPGHHDVQLVAEDRTQFGMGTIVAGAIFARTGCYLNLSDQVDPGA